MRRLAAVAAAVVSAGSTVAGGLALAGSAQVAASFDARNPKDVLGVLTTNGASATYKLDDKGNPYLDAKAGKLGFEVDFFDCDKAVACKTVLYEVNWTTTALTPDQVNGWNRWTVFCPAYTSDATHPHSWMGVQPSASETADDVKAEQDTWMGCIDDFDRFTDAPDDFLKAHK